MTITERILTYLKEQPGTPNEIAKALNLKKRGWNYYWGKWRFGDAEMLGLIEWKDEKWHLKELMGTIEKPYPEQEVDQFGLPYWRVSNWEELRSVLKKCPYASIGSVLSKPNGEMELELHDNKVWGIKEVIEEAEG